MMFGVDHMDIISVRAPRLDGNDARFISMEVR